LSISSLQASQTATQSAVRQVKEKWMQWAEDLVMAERLKLEEQHNITIGSYCRYSSSEINAWIDTGIEKLLAENQPFNLESQDKKTLEVIANRIFKNLVVVVDDNRHSSDNCALAITHHNKTNTSYLFTNVSLYAQRPDLFKEILLHEQCHVECKDVLQRLRYKRLGEDNLIRSSTNSISSDEAAEIMDRQIIPLVLAQEKRADVRMIIASPNRGEHFATFIESVTSSSESHLELGERIQFFKQIKAKLDEAEQKDLLASAARSYLGSLFGGC